MVMQRGKVLTKHSLLRGTLVPQNIPCQGNPQNFKPAITYGGSADGKKKQERMTPASLKHTVYLG